MFSFATRVGLSLGFSWTIYVILLLIMNRYEKVGTPIVKMLESIYPDCNKNYIICSTASFIDVFIFGFIAGYIYEFITLK